jgi:hypothetical protein
VVYRYEWVTGGLTLLGREQVGLFNPIVVLRWDCLPPVAMCMGGRGADKSYCGVYRWVCLTPLWCVQVGEVWINPIVACTV